MSNPRLLVFSERYWPDGSGGELATHLIVNVLSREFEVVVVTGTKNPSKVPYVEYIYEPLLSRWEKPILWLNVLKLIRTERFKKLLREADVVYVPRFAFPLIPYAKKMGKKVVAHLHDYIPISYTAVVLAPYEEHKHRITRDNTMLECSKGSKYCMGVSLLWWLPRLVRRWISMADKIICVSKRQAEIVSDQVPELGSKMEVVYNPLPQELLRAEPCKELGETPTFLYLGGDSYIKGFYILLQALRELGKQGIKAKFILTNKYRSESLEKLKRLNEKYRSLEIRVVGRIEYEKVINLHRRAWALIFPSVWEEPLPYTILESCILSTIPITPRVGGVPEIIHGTPAERLLFSVRNVNEFVGRIEQVLSLHRGKVLDIETKLRDEVRKRLNVEAIEKKLLKVFTET